MEKDGLKKQYFQVSGMFGNHVNEIKFEYKVKEILLKALLYNLFEPKAVLYRN
jgi:hypothetical protein